MAIERVNGRPGRPSGVEAAGEIAARRRAERRQPEGAGGPILPSPLDTVEISAEVRELARTQQVVAAAPDIRSDKVAEIKRRIEDGTYHVPAGLVARKLMGNVSDDR